MIITKLYGGLGNQMFQYAAGLALSEKLGTNLYMDLSWFDEARKNPDVTPRIYELDGFGIRPKREGYFDRLSARLSPPRVLKEAGLGYQPDFENLSGNIELDGYWQSYKYFDNYRDELLEIFRFPTKISPQNQKLLDQIIASKSISIHVRRGDYNTKIGRSYHGLLPLSYYQKALARLQKTVKYPDLFVFSDDITWCRKNLKLDFTPTFIDSNSPSNGVEDMRLMSACKYNIIANSSFGWWAAWLNQNSDKKIYAPKHWLVKSQADLDDRLPLEWSRL